MTWLTFHMKEPSNRVQKKVGGNSSSTLELCLYLVYWTFSLAKGLMSGADASVEVSHVRASE